MKHLAWMSAGLLAVIGSASPGFAQIMQFRPGTTNPYRTWQGPCPCPTPGTPSLPSIPGQTPDQKTPDQKTPDQQQQQPQDQQQNQPDFSQAGEFKGNIGRTSSVVAGTGLGGAVTGDPVVTGILTPFVLPGLFTAGL